MGIIFVISPDYLESLFKEAKKYDFRLQGYSSVQDAAKGLIKTNIAEILGFAFVSRMLPKDLSSLKMFLQLCNFMGVRKKFLFALNDTSRLYELFKNSSYKNLDISYLNSIEVMTDIEINRNIFGSILKYNYEPYKLTKESRVFDSYSLPKLSYKPIISQYVLKVLERVYVLDTLEHTLKCDPVYSEYKYSENDNELLIKLRETKVMIDGFYLLDDVSNETIEKSLNSCEELVKDMQNTKEFCIYRSLIYILHEKYLQKCIQ